MKTDTPYTIVAKEASEPQFQLTVVTVCWNALANLKPTVESVLAQKAKGSISIEHVVVDGVSTDGTPEWLAEQQEADNIEQYVSEPDRGIYDAMNKGINLARGRVLAFLNAGDTYTDADLAPCVRPIAEGRCAATGASARICGLPREEIFRPRYEMRYLTMPCCHQSYFASSRMYRRLGGYNAEHYKCFADADFMVRLYRATRLPLVNVQLVANYEPCGFSNNAETKFLDERLRFLNNNKALLEERCAKDSAYCRIWQAQLAHMATQLRDWQVRHGRMIPNELRIYAELCRRAARHTRNLYAKAALVFLSSAYAPRLMRRAAASRGMRAAVRFFVHACHVPDGNPYKGELCFSLSPLSSHPLFRMFRRSGRAE